MQINLEQMVQFCSLITDYLGWIFLTFSLFIYCLYHQNLSSTRFILLFSYFCPAYLEEVFFGASVLQTSVTLTSFNSHDMNTTLTGGTTISDQHSTEVYIFLTFNLNSQTMVQIYSFLIYPLQGRCLLEFPLPSNSRNTFHFDFIP